MFFVRHGEAAHNPYIVKGKAENNEELLRQGRSILNPRLTDAGRAQAEQLRQRLESGGESFDLVITSPLARAVETAHIAFGRVAKVFLVCPELVETAEPRLGGPQRGDSTAQMRRDFPFLDSWDLSHVREGDNWVLGAPLELCPAAYHHPLPIEARLEPLLAFLKARTEQTVVVVGHSMVFDRLLGKQMKNCELVEHKI